VGEGDASHDGDTTTRGGDVELGDHGKPVADVAASRDPAAGTEEKAAPPLDQCCGRLVV